MAVENIANQTVLNHRYRVLHPLGEGAQGGVFKVLDTQQRNRTLALKIVASQAAEASIRFEFEQLTRMVHPHLVRVYELGKVADVQGPALCDVGAVYFTEEFILGQPAHTWAATRPINKKAEDIARLGVAVARALAMIHSRGVMHLDIKPDNILVGPSGQFKLIDLGLSQWSADSLGVRAGTLDYIAPEVLGGAPDPRSDLYSLGATLYHLLLGVPPLRFEPIPSENPESVPSKLWQVVSRLAHTKQAERIQTASEAVLSLGRAMGPELLGCLDHGDPIPIDAASESESDETLAFKMRASDLIGRQSGLELVARFLEDVFGSARATIGRGVIAGPPGVGKSRLVQQAVVDFQIERAKNSEIPPLFVKGRLREIIVAGRSGHATDLESALLGWLRGDASTNREVADNSGLANQIGTTLASALHPTVYLIEDGDTDLAAKVMEELKFVGKTNDAESVAVIAETSKKTQFEYAFSLPESITGTLPLFVKLKPFDLREETAMVTAILGKPPPPSTMDVMHRATIGLPRLTEAVLGVMGPTLLDARRGLEKLSALTGREDFGRTIAHRIMGGIDSKSREVAEVMAIWERSVSLEEIAALWKSSSETISRCLATLNANGIVETHLDRKSALSPLVSEVLSCEMPATKKAALCLAAYTFLKERGSTDFVELSKFAAGAKKPAETNELAKKAARVLTAAGDLRGAAVQLERALTFEMGDDADKMKTALASLYRRCGKYQRAIDLALDVEKNGGPFGPKAALERAAVLRLSGQAEQSLTLLAKLTNSKNQNVSAEARALAGRIELDRGNIDEAAKRIGALEPISDVLSMRTGILSTAGMIELGRGRFERARVHFTLGLDTASTEGDLRNQAKYQGLLGILNHQEGDYESALANFRESIDFAEASSDRHGAATYAVNVAAACTELDQPEEALKWYREGISNLASIGRREELWQATANYGQLLLRCGDLASADEVTNRLYLNLIQSSVGDISASVLVHRVRADVLMALGRHDEARDLLSQVLENGWDTASVDCLTLLSTLEIREGRGDRVRQLLRQIDAAGQPPNPAASRERLRLELELSLLEGGDTQKALDQLISLLPDKGEGHRLIHLDSFLTAARGAMALNRKDAAKTYANQSLDIISRFEQATPSLHKLSKNPKRREMQDVLDRLKGFGMSVTETTNRVSFKDWKYLIRINSRLNSEYRIGRLFDTIMDAATDITGAERGFVFVVDSEKNLHIRSARNIAKATITAGEDNYSHSVAMRCIESNDTVLTTDAQEDPRFMSKRSVVNLNLRYIVAVPLQIRGENQGAIYLDSQGGARFDESRVALLRALADQAAIALFNARLIVENRQRQARIERLNQKLTKKLKVREGELNRVRKELIQKNDELFTRYRYKEIVSKSAAMEKVFSVLDRVTDSNLPVVVVGKSGTGKELVAKALHFNGPRKRRPFVVENCGAIPETLLESVLFGHVKGAFTGAIRENPGLFVQAHKGTLFLDEVSAMPAAMQIKLLRVLQSGEVRPVGGRTSRIVDVRIVVATNVSLTEWVQKGRFREDLLYRLNVITVKLPPLVERPEDIPLLAAYFVERHGSGKNLKVSKEAMEALSNYAWPGNVRQLENEVMRAAVLSDDIITLENLSDEIKGPVRPVDLAVTDFDMNRQVEMLKQKMIEAALSKTRGNQSAAAKMLKLSRYGLQKMMARFEIP